MAKKFFLVLFCCICIFADTLPLPQLNQKTGKWEYVDDGKQSKQKRLTTETHDLEKGIPSDIFDLQTDINTTDYGKLAKLSVSISGGQMKFFGKYKNYYPVQKLIYLGESGSIKVYCNEGDCKNNAPELLYYAYKVINGTPTLFVDTLANDPIQISIDNSILRSNKVINNVSINSKNSFLEPKNITLQIFKSK